MFEDFFSSLGGLFGGSDSGGIPEGQTAQGGTNIPQAGAPGGQQGGGNPLMSLILGVGAPLLSRLMGDPSAGALKNLTKGSNVGTNVGTQLIKRASQGKLTDPQQASVDAMKAQEMARWNQYLAGLGIPVSTAMVQGQNEVDMKAQKLANDLINQSFTQGLDALKIGGSESNALLTQAMAQKKDMSQAIAEVAKQLGLILNQPQGSPGTTTNANARVPEAWGQPDPNYSEPDPQYSYMDPFLE